MSKIKISSKGLTWDELEKRLFTEEEIAESRKRVSLINKMIKAKESKMKPESPEYLKTE